jgi:hypothetical protein
MAFRGLCTVSNAGITLDGRAALLLKYPTFPSGRNFKSAPNLTREVLAVALAAITSNKQVYCDIPDETEWANVSQINLMSGQ